MKTAVANGISKQDEKYIGLIEGYLEQFREIRAEMKRSKAEIERMKAASLRKLAEIDLILNRA